MLFLHRVHYSLARPLSSFSAAKGDEREGEWHLVVPSSATHEPGSGNASARTAGSLPPQRLNNSIVWDSARAIKSGTCSWHLVLLLLSLGRSWLVQTTLLQELEIVSGPARLEQIRAALSRWCRPLFLKLFTVRVQVKQQKRNHAE